MLGLYNGTECEIIYYHFLVFFELSYQGKELLLLLLAGAGLLAAAAWLACDSMLGTIRSENGDCETGTLGTGGGRIGCCGIITPGLAAANAGSKDC